MDKKQFDKLFQAAFPNAVKQSYEKIQLPAKADMKQSWNKLKKII